MRQIESHIALIGDHLTFEVWGRSAAKAESVVSALQPKCKITVADDLAVATRKADIVVTATGSTAPLIKEAWVGEGTHITAIGADAPGKQELETRLISRADVLVADSIDQCLDHGEMSHAFGQELISRQNVVEIGATLSRAEPGRTNCRQVTIADLTGVAAQDIAIARVVLEANRKDEHR
jgi:ornithine cyclodeaminase/alanine dehydrogenase-like protein (mu-crystallin family)